MPWENHGFFPFCLFYRFKWAKSREVFFSARVFSSPSAAGCLPAAAIKITSGALQPRQERMHAARCEYSIQNFNVLSAHHDNKQMSFSSAGLYWNRQNAVTFAPHSGAKVLAPLPGSLAQQGFRGIRFHAGRAAAPSRSPAPTQPDSVQPRFFDRLKHTERPAPQAGRSVCF